MPAKRKLRPSTLDPSPSSDPALPAPSTSPTQSDSFPKPELTTSTSGGGLNDAWTDEQEISLLKAIVRWKPVGMHKHFRMISIFNYLQAQPCVSPGDEHMKIPGVWEKLGSLYNLPVLDEREDSVLASPPPSPKSGTKPDPIANSTFQPFTLPSEYSDMMFERRLAPEGSKSPPLSAFSVKSQSRRESTAQDSEDPRSSPVTGASARKKGRSTRATAAGRAAVLAAKEAEEHEVEEDVEEAEEAGSGSGEEGSVGDDEEDEQGGADADAGRAKRRRSATASTARGKASRGRGRGRARGRR